MRVVQGVEEVLDVLRALPRGRVGFVPTMGGLHAGHMALVDASRAACEVTVVSIFVNPAQFAPGEDLAAYPRPRDADLALLAAAAVDVVFAPVPADVYPEGYCTYVTTAVGDPAANPAAEGASRPTFFRGVATVVTKLLVLLRPDVVYFGRKDAQQCAVVRTLVRDLWLGPFTKVALVDTVREPDGLAMSSRNEYLTREERSHATILFKALCACKKAAVDGGERNSSTLRTILSSTINTWSDGEKPADVNFSLIYVSVCRSEDMKEIAGLLPEENECLACVAAMLGKTRLIDNMVISGPNTPLRNPARTPGVKQS